MQNVEKNNVNEQTCFVGRRVDRRWHYHLVSSFKKELLFGNSAIGFVAASASKISLLLDGGYETLLAKHITTQLD